MDIPTQLFAEIPAALRRAVVTDWSRANKRGEAVPSFLEGPCFDRQGRL
jgi:gluconolactonase